MLAGKAPQAYVKTPIFCFFPCFSLLHMQIEMDVAKARIDGSRDCRFTNGVRFWVDF
jgi:hypothetical protein